MAKLLLYLIFTQLLNIQYIFNYVTLKNAFLIILMCYMYVVLGM